MTQEVEEDDSVSVVVSLGETDPGDKEWTRIQLPRVDVTEGSSILPNPPSRYYFLIIYHFYMYIYIYIFYKKQMFLDIYH